MRTGKHVQRPEDHASMSGGQTKRLCPDSEVGGRGLRPESAKCRFPDY